jgi:uncharacterized membrane protein
MKRLGVVAILVLAFLGIANAAYLAQHELAGTPLICNIQNLSGCNTVAASPYANIWGIPVAVYGVIFYAVIFAIAALELFIFDRFLRRVIQILTVIGVIAELGFTFIQVYLIQALCVYCLTSAAIMFFILLFASIIEPVRRTMFDHTVSPPSAPPHLPMPPTT